MVGDILGGPQINRGGASLSNESVEDALDADLFLAAPTIVPSLRFIVGPHLKATFLAPLTCLSRCKDQKTCVLQRRDNDVIDEAL